MAYFPFYIDISDKVCVIVGGGRIAYRKIEALSEFGATILVIAPKICEDIYKLEQAHNDRNMNGKKQIIIKNRDFVDQDILEADIIVAATNDTELNTHISELGKMYHKLVNVVDVKEECSFIFPAIIKQKDLVVAISTGGSSPAMASKIKKEIETIIPDYYSELIELLGDYREIIKSNISEPADRMNAYQDIIYLAEIKNSNLTEDEILSIIGMYQ